MEIVFSFITVVSGDVEWTIDRLYYDARLSYYNPTSGSDFTDIYNFVLAF